LAKGLHGVSSMLMNHNYGVSCDPVLSGASCSVLGKWHTYFYLIKRLCWEYYASPHNCCLGIKVPGICALLFVGISNHIYAAITSVNMMSDTFVW